MTSWTKYRIRYQVFSELFWPLFQIVNLFDTLFFFFFNWAIFDKISCTSCFVFFPFLFCHLIFFFFPPKLSEGLRHTLILHGISAKIIENFSLWLFEVFGCAHNTWEQTYASIRYYIIHVYIHHMYVSKVSTSGYIHSVKRTTSALYASVFWGWINGVENGM